MDKNQQKIDLPCRTIRSKNLSTVVVAFKAFLPRASLDKSFQSANSIFCFFKKVYSIYGVDREASGIRPYFLIAQLIQLKLIFESAMQTKWLRINK